MTGRDVFSARIVSAAAWIGRSLAVGAAYLAFTLLGGCAARALRLPAFSMGSSVDPGLSLILAFVSGVLIGLILGPFAARLPLPWLERAGVLFVTLYGLNCLVNTIEAFFYTANPASDWTSFLLLSVIQYGGTAAVLAWVFRPQSADRSLLEILREAVRTRRWSVWAVRFVLAGVLYVPVYWFFGLLVAPYVMPYYQDPSFGLHLTIPPAAVVMSLETGRGLLYALILFPLIALLGAGERRSFWGITFWIILVQAVLGSWHPMLNASFYPVDMRLAHGVEITADCILYGILAVWLLAPGRTKSDSVRTDSPFPA